VAGYPTGGGNHHWARANPIPTRDAWAEPTLLDAGATLIRKIITDEVSRGILGEDAFDGTPLNPKARDRAQPAPRPVPPPRSPPGCATPCLAPTPAGR
jgi:amidase